MIGSEKRHPTTIAGIIPGASRVGVIPMPTQIFSLERVNPPIGRMLIVTDDEHRPHTVGWEDHEPRMLGLSRRHYGANAV
jgi:hypothetical protein